MLHGRRFRHNRRGLAEIVGTLMLVLIVVAAATAFSFFVASEEQINLNEQSQLHMKNLENVTIQSVDNCPGATSPCTLVIILSSSDIYSTNVSEIAVGGDPATTFCQTPENGVPVSCASPPTNYQTFTAAGGDAWLNLSPFTVTAVTIPYTSFYLQPFVFSASSVQIQMGTLRGNEFVETLFSPVAEIGVDFVTGYPVLDGTQSYQPHTGSSPDATINQWTWVVASTPTGDPDDNTYFGEQAELPNPFVHGTVYSITLTVSNTIGLSGTVTETYPPA